MSRKERHERTERSERNEKPKSYLTPEEDARRQELFRSLIYHKKTQQIDLKAPVELILLIVYSKLENRELVEDDMKELKSMIGRVADRIGEIIEKSKGKAQTPRIT
jgi:hypothetical protein